MQAVQDLDEGFLGGFCMGPTCNVERDDDG
jgi:hypothetical protein